VEVWLKKTKLLKGGPGREITGKVLVLAIREKQDLFFNVAIED
jgi:hypothetical protein